MPFREKPFKDSLSSFPCFGKIFPMIFKIFCEPLFARLLIVNVYD